MTARGIDEVLVVGAGAMGRWFARTVESDTGADVAFADVDPDAASAAADELGGTTTTLDGDDRYDVVCIAVPIPAAVETVECQGPRARRALVDVVGVMDPVVAAARESAPGCERVSFHPLFAPENAPGRVAAVVDQDGPTAGAIRAAIEAAGNQVVETTPAAHDEAMESVQARAHAAVLAFALAVEPVPGAFATPVYEQLAATAADVTGGDPRVYADIQATFDGAEDVARAAREVADADAEAFADLYHEAGQELLERPTVGSDPTDEGEGSDPTDEGEGSDPTDGEGDRT